MKAVLGRGVVMVASFLSGPGGCTTWFLYESGVSLRATFSAARSRLVPRGTAAHGYGCKCEGHGSVAPSPTSPGLQPPAGFAAASPGVPPLLTWTLRRLLLTLSPFTDRRTTGGGSLR